ncbi:MAG TPA: hypothetical protein VK968_16300, partial [Roseimicrobium sp.]|nr:hypothetical protein [Roseimicrobium sp.]
STPSPAKNTADPASWSPDDRVGAFLCSHHTLSNMPEITDMPLTRREFLSSLVPPWLTKRAVFATLIVAGGLFVALELAEVVRGQGFAASMTGAGVLAGIGLTVFLLTRLTSIVRRAVAAASPDFQSFASNLSRVLECVIAMFIGAFLYARWSSGADITSTLIVLGIGLLATLFRDDKTPETRKNES